MVWLVLLGGVRILSHGITLAFAQVWSLNITLVDGAQFLLVRSSLLVRVIVSLQDGKDICLSIHEEFNKVYAFLA